MSDPASSSHPVPGFAALAGVVIIWSTITTVLKYFTGILDPWAMIGIRYTMVALAAAPFLLRAWVRDRGGIPWRAAWVPAVIFAAGQMLWSIAPYHNPASLVMFIGRCAFFFAMIAGFLLLDSERWMLRRPLFWVGGAVISLGLGLMLLAASGGEETAVGISVEGVAIMTATALCWGCYGVSVKRWLPGVPAQVGFPLLAVLIWPPLFVGFLCFADTAPIATLDARQWGLLVLASVGSIGLGQFLSYLCMQTLGPIVTEGTYNMIPFTTAVIAGWWLDERLPPLLWLAGCTMVAGSACLLVLRARRERGGPRTPAGVRS